MIECIVGISTVRTCPELSISVNDVTQSPVAATVSRVLNRLNLRKMSEPKIPLGRARDDDLRALTVFCNFIGQMLDKRLQNILDLNAGTERDSSPGRVDEALADVKAIVRCRVLIRYFRALQEPAFASRVRVRLVQDDLVQNHESRTDPQGVTWSMPLDAFREFDFSQRIHVNVEIVSKVRVKGVIPPPATYACSSLDFDDLMLYQSHETEHFQMVIQVNLVTTLPSDPGSLRPIY